MNRRSLARRAGLWLPPILLMAAIYGFSSESNPMPAVTAHVWDKLLHTVEYASVAILIARALAGGSLNTRATIIVATLLTSAYGATDEYHQRFVPQRSADAADWAADTVGAALGAVAYVVASKRAFTRPS